MTRYGGNRAYSCADSMYAALRESGASDLRGAVAKRLAGHLTHFAFPLAAQRSHDAAAFMREGGRVAAAGLLQRKARCFGEAQ